MLRGYLHVMDRAKAAREGLAILQVGQGVSSIR